MKLRKIHVRSKGRYTLSVKLGDFTVWCHTLRKNWVNCAVLTGNSTGFRTVVSIRLSHTELCRSLRESHSFLNLPADTTMVSYQGNHLHHPFLVIHSAEDHCMIYSFSNTTSNSTFSISFLLFGQPMLCQGTFSSVVRVVFLHS